jgi:hypothetical protein
MADHNKPVTTSAYANFVTEIDARFDDLTIGLDPALVTPTNLPTNAIRWTSAANRWEKWNGSAWAVLSSLYAINISGNAATATLASTVTTNANLTGDVTSTGNATTIANNVVSLAKLGTMATASLLGRNTASTGNVEVLSASTAKSLLGLNNVTNTNDASKPVSTAQQAALDLKANLNSPSFTTPNLGAAAGTSLTLTTKLAVTEGGTGRGTGTTAYSLIATGTTATGAHQSLAVGLTTQILVGGGASALPVWTAATGSGAPVRAISPTLETPILGVATGTSFNGITGLSSAAPIIDGAATAGAATTVSRADHVHPTDTSRAPVTSPSFTGPASVSANSTSPALTVTQTGIGPALLIEDSASVDSTPFIIDANGKVGIGTLMPIAELDLVGSALINAKPLRPSGVDATDAVTNDKLGSAAFLDVGQVPLNIWPVTKSSAYAVTADDSGKTLIVSGTTTITLPAASAAFSGSRPFCVRVKAVTGATVTVARQGSDTIETVSGNKSMTANTALTFFPISATAWETI